MSALSFAAAHRILVSMPHHFPSLYLWHAFWYHTPAAQARLRAAAHAHGSDSTLHGISLTEAPPPGAIVELLLV